MDLIIEHEGEQYNVIIGLEDYMNEPKTILKEIRMTVEHIEKESE
jgi:type III secretory pathway component EscU